MEISMITGKVAEWINRLDDGEAVILTIDDLAESAKAYTDSGFDHVRSEYIQNIINEVNSSEYLEFTLWERMDGRWTLEREQKNL